MWWVIGYFYNCTIQPDPFKLCQSVELWEHVRYRWVRTGPWHWRPDDPS